MLVWSSRASSLATEQVVSHLLLTVPSRQRVRFVVSQKSGFPTLRGLVSTDLTVIDDIATALLQSSRCVWRACWDIEQATYPRTGPIPVFAHCTWILDLDRGHLYWLGNEGPYSAPISLLCERLLMPDDFVPVQADSSSRPDSTKHAPPRWDATCNAALTGKQVLVSRLLQDFIDIRVYLFQYPQSEHTIRRIGEAILRIAALDFAVFDHDHQAESHDIPRPPDMFEQTKKDLREGATPPPRHGIVRGGQTWFSLAHDVEAGQAAIRAYASLPPAEYSGDDISANNDGIYYGVLTLHHVVLLRQASDGVLESTKPGPLFGDGYYLRSQALNLLLWATGYSIASSHNTRLHRLPVELQDMILRASSPSSVTGAYLSCALSLGTLGHAFLWKDNGTGRRLNLVQPQQLGVGALHSDGMGTESMIWFGDIWTGLSYQADWWMDEEEEDEDEDER